MTQDTAKLKVQRGGPAEAPVFENFEVPYRGRDVSFRCAHLGPRQCRFFPCDPLQLYQRQHLQGVHGEGGRQNGVCLYGTSGHNAGYGRTAYEQASAARSCH